MKRVLALAAALSLLGVSGQDASAEDIRVMTQNQFLGADLGPILLAVGGPPAVLLQVLQETLGQIADNDFPLRSQALAEQICDKQPHVVGLQEVFRFEFNGDIVPVAPLPFVDHLDELMVSIAGQCNNYVVGASVQNVDVAQTVTGFGTIRVVDRDVILVRNDVFFLPVPFSGNACAPTMSGVPLLPASGCHYGTLVPLPPSIGGFILRGYVGVDALVGGTFHRVVNTHLEVMFPGPPVPISMFFQAAQATELISVLSVFPKPPGARTIVVGDINSSPDDAADATLPFVPPYAQLAAGVSLVGAPISLPYTDTWDLRPGNDPGFTCCNDEDLSDRKTDHDERIDVIFSLEAPNEVKANVMGGEKSDRIKGLWPSDHCTVVGDLTF